MTEQGYQEGQSNSDLNEMRWDDRTRLLRVLEHIKKRGRSWLEIEKERVGGRDKEEVKDISSIHLYKMEVVLKEEDMLVEYFIFF
jgi:hypothetical protein